MAWRDRYLPASFRSVGFFVSRASVDGGRRIVTHEFPRQTKPYHEDLGKRVRTYQVSAYVLGTDFDLLARQLEEALDEEGAGTLTHPLYGQRPVIVLEWSRRDEEVDAGIAVFDIEFQEKHRLEFPTTRPDFKKAIADERAGISVDGAKDWLAKIRTGLVPSFVTDAITGATTLMGTAMQALDVFSGPAAEVAALQKNITNLLDNASALLTAPATLAAAILDAVDAVGNAAPSSRAALAAYESLLGVDATPLKKGGTSSLGLSADTNAQVTIDLMRWSACGGAIAAAFASTWDSYDQALEARDRVEALLEALLDAAPDQTYQRLAELRGLLVRAVPPDAESLPRLETITLPRAVPSLVLSYRRYGDLSQADALVARNGVRHPAFVPAGEPLEVLVDDV